MRATEGKRGSCRPLLSGFLLFLLLSIPLWGAPAEEEKPDLSNDACLMCHSDPELTKVAPGGIKVSLFVDGDKFKKSVHGTNDCVSCHADISEIPHAETLAKVECGMCHGDEADIYAESTHGKAFAAKIPVAPTCVTCHGNHDILPRSDPDSRIHPLNQVKICTTCHLNPEIAGKYNLPTMDKIEAYETGVHGRGLLKSGLLSSATCVSCHSSHNVRPKTDPKSTIYWSNIPETCGKCHLGILKAFKQSTHGKMWEKRAPQGPGCVTCHGSHGIQDPVAAEFQLHIPLICARCHAQRAPTYYDTFHGEAKALGFIRAATCSDCHTPHLNLPESDPASTVSKEKVKQTCMKCHPAATASFVTYDPHANPDVKGKSPVLYYVYHFMVLLLYGTFGFFGIHTILWLQRSIVGALRGEFEKHQNGDGPWVQRFGVPARIVHGCIILSFLGLAFTGLPLRFHFAPSLATMVSLLGGVEVFRFFHRLFALVTFGYATFHLGTLLNKIVMKKERKLLYGPLSMVPRPRDLVDLYHQVKWFLYVGKPAQLDRWTYWEKFDYFAVFWGVPVIGSSGLMLWFPRFFTTFLPGYVLNFAKVVHSEEALLAVGFIFVFHFFHTHLRPEAFPMDLVVFTGSMPLERFKKERPEEYDRLVRDGELEKALVPAPSPKMKRFATIVGTIGLTIGILLVIQILLSVLLWT